MFCRCTECGTGFALSAAQLRAGHGRVRCGTCLAVFDALQTLSDEFQTPPTTAPPGDELQSQSTPGELHGIEAAMARADKTTPHLPPRAEASGQPVPGTAPDVAPSPATLSPGEPSDPPSPARAAPSPAEPPESRVLQPGPAPESPPARSPLPLPLRPQGIAPHAEDEYDSVAALRIVPVEARPPAPARSEPSIGTTPMDGGEAGDRRKSASHDEDDDVPEVLREDMARLASARRARRATLGFGLGCLLLTAGLLLQWAWFEPQDVLARYPQARPWLEQLCARTGCVLPERRDPSRVRMVTRDVRVHPRYEGALRVTASLMNTAPYTQPYPRLHFTLFNVNGQVIASRVFEPEQYLSDDLDPAAEMRPRVPVQVALELIAPEDAAVSFEFDFL